MPTRNVNLTDALDDFVRAKVVSGKYENASEVAGLQVPDREEQQFEAKLATLRFAVNEGDQSALTDGNAFDRVRQSLKLHAKKH